MDNYLEIMIERLIDTTFKEVLANTHEDDKPRIMRNYEKVKNKTNSLASDLKGDIKSLLRE